MIWNNLINFVLGLLTGIINLLPTLTSADEINIDKIENAASSIRAFFVSQNFWFPVDDLFRIIGLLIVLELLITGFKIARWIASNLSAGFLK